MLNPAATLTLPVVLTRLTLALLCGVVIGYGRSRRQQDTGLGIYVLVTLGAAISSLIPIFQLHMLNGPWAEIVARVGSKYDASRMAAQVVAGIGFLGAGIILKTDHQQVHGLTTATGLFASVCLGIAAGLGFYACVLSAVVLIALVLNAMGPLEAAFKRHMRNITLYVVYGGAEDLDTITGVIEAMGAQIFEIDIERAEPKKNRLPSAIFIMKLSRENHSHSAILSSVAELSCVHEVQELIS